MRNFQPCLAQSTDPPDAIPTNPAPLVTANDECDKTSTTIDNLDETPMWRVNGEGRKKGEHQVWRSKRSVKCET